MSDKLGEHDIVAPLRKCALNADQEVSRPLYLIHYEVISVDIRMLLIQRQK